MMMSNIVQDLRTTTFNYRSKEFYVNLKPSDIPPSDSEEYFDFIENEENKSKRGVNINGIFIPGTLYFHLNHWMMLVDVEDEHGDTSVVMKHPDFRDNEWVIHNALYDAEKRVPGIKEREMLVQGGCRQIAKTVTMASVISGDLTLRDNITDLIVCSNQDDVDNVLRYIFAGMDNTTDFLRVPRITKSKDENEFLFGHKDIEGNNIIKSKLLTRNTQGGVKTQVSAGTTIHRGVFDEIGKSKMLGAFEAMKPAMRGKMGFRSSGILTFTGGEVEKSKDAEDIFYNPKSIGAREFDVEGRKTGLFLSGLYRTDLKKQITCGEYFELDPSHELYDFPMYIRDEELAKVKLAKELEEAAKANSQTSLINHRIYYPMVTGDMFLRENANPFPLDALVRHREKLAANPVGTAVELYKDQGVVKHKASNKRIINEFPIVSKNINLDAPIMIYDFPKYAEYYNLHVIGVDPYNQDFTLDSDSLGSVYVMRRIHSDLTDNYQNCIVASYTARPTTKEFLRNLEYLQEFYNGEILYEDSQQLILPHFEHQNKGHVLMDTFDLQREINPKTRAGNKKGLKAGKMTNERRLGGLINYLEEDLGDGILGLERIPDPLLIDELIAFNGMGEGTRNTDRVDGFSYCLLQLQSLQKYLIHRPFIVSTELKNKKPTPLPRNAFGFSYSTFKKKRNAFGF